MGRIPLIVFLCILLFALPKKEGICLSNPITHSPFATTLSPTGFTVSNVQFVMDNNGDVVTAWSVFNGSNVVLQSAFKLAGGIWTIPGDPRLQQNIISPLRFTANNFQLVGDQQGNAVLVWQIFNGTSVVIQASFKGLGDPWPIQGSPIFQSNVLSFFGFDISVSPSVAIGNGNVVIAWQVFNNTNTVVQVSTRSNAPGANFTQPGSPISQGNVISPFRFNVISNPTAAVDNTGNAIVGWRLFNGTTTSTVGSTIVQAVTKSVNSPFFQTISGVNVSQQSFQTSIDPRQQANILSPLRFNVVSNPLVDIGNNNPIVLWTLFDGATTVLQSFPAAPAN